MIKLERYERIRSMLKDRVSTVAKRYHISLGGMNSFSDITINLLGPTLEDLGQEYLDKHAKLHLTALWTTRKYLRLVEKYFIYRDKESTTLPNGKFTYAFPDLQRESEIKEKGAIYYVQKSAERLQSLNFLSA